MPQTALSPAASPAIFPDPVLSANVYCSGRLCEVIARLAAPFWQEYRERSSVPGSYLWFLRYARCGEHLKIRIHAPEAEAPLLRELLLAAQAGFFAGLAPPLPGGKRKSTPAAPPIDAEDRVATDYPDRTFLWTEYGRSHLSLGYRPYLDDDHYSALLTRCLGTGAEIVLGRLESGPDGQCPYHLQRSIWIDALFAGLRAMPFSARERTLYLLYHRDCLLRYFRKRKEWVTGGSAMGKVILQFNQQIDELEMREELAGIAAELWDPGRPQPPGALGDWHDALRALSDHVSRLPAGPAYHIDPFADHPLFPVFFKAFHGLANQIGFDAPNEAFLYHSLVAATGETDLRDRPVRLKPDLH